jgi:hypothetical protein
MRPVAVVWLSKQRTSTRQLVLCLSILVIVGLPADSPHAATPHPAQHIYNNRNSLSPFAGLAFHPVDGMIQVRR